MSWWTTLQTWRDAPGLAASTPDGEEESEPRPISAMFLEMMGGAADNPRVTRAEALSVPGVLRGRNLLCSIATLPLEQRGPDRSVVRSPLLEQIDPNVPNVVTLAQTVEDLVFEAQSWWKVTALGWDGYPVNAVRVDPNLVSLQPPPGFQLRTLPSGEHAEGSVWINGEPVPASRVIRFDSPNPPILAAAGRSIRRAVLYAKTAANYANDPSMREYFTPTESADPVDDDAVQEVLDAWQTARRLRSTGYVPAALKYNAVEAMSPADLQLVELQKQAAVDVANMLGLDPEDLGISTTSRTYANAVDRRRDRINDVLAPYMRAITDRLSMGDVTKRGYGVLFNLDDYMKSNPTERWSTYETALANNVLSVEEIRAKEGEPAVPVEPRPVPQTAAAAPQEAPMLSRQFNADGPTAVGFAMDEATAAFRVNREKRTISGLLVPWGAVSDRANGAKWSFAKDTIDFEGREPRIKLNREHDRKQTVGVAVRVQATPAGLDGSFKIGRGPAGDEVLSLAEDGILDGFSVELDMQPGDITEDDQGVRRPTKSVLRHVAITSSPAFDDARVTSVAASREDSTMTDSKVTPAAGAPVTAEVQADAPASQFSAQLAELVKAEFAKLTAKPDEKPGEGPQVVDPTTGTRPAAQFAVTEALPYRFDRGGNFTEGEHTFSADLSEMARTGDQYGNTEAGKRVMDLIKAQFAIGSGDVNELNPTIQRPDMYVDQRDYRTPLWNFVNKGAPPNGVTPFTFPKFNSASGLVNDHTEGVEPNSGTFTTTGQTVTPTALSGKASIPREVWDMGGNPAVSTLIWNQMKRGWKEGLESATATFLNTLTAAADVTLAAGSADDVLAGAWDAALADLQFVRGYDWEALALEKELYKKSVAAVDADGRKLYPQINPTNANGTASRRFVTLELGGVTGVPSWALPSTPGSPNNSWLFDPAVVHGWASAPQRLEFAGTAAATTEDPKGSYAPVAMIDIAIWGYKAFANSDIGGVRQVIYDTTA